MICHQNSSLPMVFHWVATSAITEVRLPIDQLSPDLVNTLLLSEDHRFYNHSGMDFKAYLRVLYGVLTFNSGAKGGGSTITQQLAKNLFSTRGA